MSLPNLITLSRLLSVPLIVWLITTNQFAYAFGLFVLAGVSDAVDGLLAKRFDMRTELGAYLDPIADKALLVSIYVTLGLQLHLEGFVVILVVSRDIAIVGAIMISYMIGHQLQIHPLWISKVNTTAQIALAALVLAALGFGFDAGRIQVGGEWLVAVTTVSSGFIYCMQWLRSIAAAEGAGSK